VQAGRANQPLFDAGRGDLTGAPAGQLFEDAGADEIDDGPSAQAGEAEYLGEGDGGDGLGLASFGFVAGEPAGLD
jgi:hypothetical protein